MFGGGEGGKRVDGDVEVKVDVRWPKWKGGRRGARGQ